MSRRDKVREIEGVDLNALDWLTTFATTRRSRVRFQQLQRLVRSEGYESLASDPKIVVSTMHASKGKEADLVVIVPDCTGIVRRNIATPTETRLAYVALTRAKREAMIVIPRTDSYVTHFFA
jgi:superfamily I DNA/RNA helicase